MGSLMMVWVCSLPLKAFELAGLMLRKFYKGCFSCCTNQAICKSRILSQIWPTVRRVAIAGSPHVPLYDLTFADSTRLWHTSRRSNGSRVDAIGL